MADSPARNDALAQVQSKTAGTGALEPGGLQAGLCGSGSLGWRGGGGQRVYLLGSWMEGKGLCGPLESPQAVPGWDRGLLCGKEQLMRFLRPRPSQTLPLGQGSFPSPGVGQDQSRMGAGRWGHGCDLGKAELCDPFPSELAGSPALWFTNEETIVEPVAAGAERQPSGCKAKGLERRPETEGFDSESGGVPSGGVEGFWGTWPPGAEDSPGQDRTGMGSPGVAHERVDMASRQGTQPSVSCPARPGLPHPHSCSPVLATLATQTTAVGQGEAVGAETQVGGASCMPRSAPLSPRTSLGKQSPRSGR